MTPVLEVEELRVAFGAYEAVRGVSLHVRSGETLALVGESGSGKTMTALAVPGLLPPAARATGRIRLRGKELLGLPDKALEAVRGAQVGLVFQEPMTALNPVLTVGLQMTEALARHQGLSRAAAEREAIALLGRVGIADGAARLRQYPHEFSGGMRQRILIAAAMALRPALLVADEPTTALDVTVQAQVLALLRDLVRETGTALLLITHDMGVVAETADRVAVMQAGQVVEEGTAAELFARPRHPCTQALLAAVPRPDAAARGTAGDAVPPPPPVLQVDGVSKAFRVGGPFRPRAVPALEEVSLHVARGETLALVGESGSGKSTLGRVCARLLPADRGRVLLAGQDLSAARGRRLRALRRQVGIVFQDPYASLDPRRRVGSAVAEPLLIHGLVHGAAARQRAAVLLEEAGLSAAFASRYPHELSGGQRQRVAIARALAAEPALVVADEPTSALDVSVQAGILELLLGLQLRRGLAILFITHDLAVVRRVAHRIAVMRAGRLVELGPASAVLGAPLHPYTRALLAAAPVADPARARRAPVPVPPLPPPLPLREAAAGHLVADGFAVPGHAAPGAAAAA